MADLGKTLNELFELNEDEKFYKDYFEVSASSGQLKKFLDKVDLDDAIRRHLIIPELLPDIISYEMNDDEYFKDNDRNVFISKHNRYTPPFLHKHDFFEIIFVFTGHCSQTISTTRKDFTEGDLILLPRVCIIRWKSLTIIPSYSTSFCENPHFHRCLFR